MRTISEPTPEALYVTAAPLIVEAILTTLNTQGHCVLGIVGGRSMAALLDHCAPYADQMKGHIDVFWLDERIAAEKNYAPALPLLEKLRTNGVDISWYPLQAMQKQAMEIELHQLMQQFTVLTGTPRFDVIILSAGEDGHIASLFPHKDTLHNTALTYMIVDHAPKPPPLRVTVTVPLLLSAKHAFLLFVGDKHDAYDAFVREGPFEECPARLVKKVPDATALTSLTRNPQ